MSEKTRLAAILIFPFIFFSVYYFVSTSLEGAETSFGVSSYDISIDVLKNKVAVSEELTYDLAVRGYRELYRTYDKDGPQAGLVTAGSRCPPGAVFERRDYGSYFELICSNPGYYSAGTHTVEFNYEIPSPYTCYSDYCELHWKVLDSFGSDIRDISLTVNGETTEIATFPAGYVSVSSVSIEQIPQGSLFEIRLLIPREAVEGTVRGGEAEGDFRSYTFFSSLYTWVYRLRRAIVFAALLIPAIFLYSLYQNKGKEIDIVGAPDVLHYAPSELKPHELDYFFSGRIGSFEGAIVDATLLSLAQKDYVKIEKDRIRILKEADANLDDYEKKVLDFYSRNSEGGVFDVKQVKRDVKSSRSRARRMLKELNGLKQAPESLKKRLEKFYDISPKYTAMKIVGGGFVASLALLIVSLAMNLMYVPMIGIVLTPIFFLWMVALWILDDYVFGKFSYTAIEEKTKWDAFKNLLGNQSMIEKYAPQDVAMWGDWLVYATVFGSAKNVVKYMKAHRISIPNVDDPNHLYRMNRIMWRTTMSSAAPKSSGGRAGGVGGGFGGGGGGAR